MIDRHHWEEMILIRAISPQFLSVEQQARHIPTKKLFGTNSVNYVF